ncbi:putative protein U26 [Suid betaherpesvirus 2]|uniref:Uncharacterized protein n=1 Tax=Suid betaherpesvirus 2 TaxID=1608255 RepID=U3GQ06_9BETA|nr:putative protein U26 [Suid betaherpesvirus 2]AGT99220.1 putative protein U26 [Suid betaherpesvirus 2]
MLDLLLSVVFGMVCGLILPGYDEMVFLRFMFDSDWHRMLFYAFVIFIGFLYVDEKVMSNHTAYNSMIIIILCKMILMTVRGESTLMTCMLMMVSEMCVYLSLKRLQLYVGVDPFGWNSGVFTGVFFKVVCQSSDDWSLGLYVLSLPFLCFFRKARKMLPVILEKQDDVYSVTTVPHVTLCVCLFVMNILLHKIFLTNPFMIANFILLMKIDVKLLCMEVFMCCTLLMHVVNLLCGGAVMYFALDLAVGIICAMFATWAGNCLWRERMNNSAGVLTVFAIASLNL